METTERTTRRKVLSFGAKASALAMALVAVGGNISEAGAQRPPDNGDSHQRMCRALYDRAEALREEYKRVGLANPGSSRLDAILAELRTIGSDWIALRCKDRYGSIAVYRLPTGQWINPDHISEWEDWVTTTDSSGSATITPATDGQGASNSISRRKRKKGKRSKRGRR